MRGRPPAGARNQVFLEYNGWNDYGWNTLWNVHLVDEDGERHRASSVRIGKFGLTDSQRVDLPSDEFDALGDEYFCLGSDDSFYSTVAALGDDYRVAVLKGLNDCAYDLEILERARGEPVMQEALLRSITIDTVRGQYHRIATGGVVLSPYEFSVSNPYVDSAGEIRSSIDLDFIVQPESQPRTNVHVVIGRNGIGKSVLLNNIANALVRPGDPRNGSIQFREQSDSRLTQQFSRVVSVAFSAFDEFEPLLPGEASGNLTFDYIGLKISDDEDEVGAPVRLKDNLALEQEFAESVQECLLGARRARWHHALEVLESDPMFSEAEIATLTDIGDRRQIERTARSKFRQLSSGHKVILLTITRLVETVEEATLVLLDEPEGHLHPPLLAAFIRALSDLLENRNGVAVIATHSPVVLQEVPASCVWKLRRSGWEVYAERPEIETFGENVGILTQEVFGLEVTASGFHRTLSEAAATGRSYQRLLEDFDHQLGGEARAILRALVLETGTQ
jgi:predicted ATPase